MKAFAALFLRRRLALDAAVGAIVGGTMGVGMVAALWLVGTPLEVLRRMAPALAAGTVLLVVFMSTLNVAWSWLSWRRWWKAHLAQQDDAASGRPPEPR